MGGLAVVGVLLAALDLELEGVAFAHVGVVGAVLPEGHLQFLGSVVVHHLHRRPGGVELVVQVEQVVRRGQHGH